MPTSGKYRLLACASVLIAACASETVVEQSDDVTGRWVTDTPAYADRGFEITEDQIYLLLGGTDFTVHPIESVEMVLDDLPLYTIEYTGDEGDTFSFRFYYSQEEGGTIFFPNQERMKWRRDPGADVPWVLSPSGGRP